MKKPKYLTIPIDKIVRNDDYYARVKPSWFRINEYADAIRTGSQLPTPLVAQDGDVYVSLDGWQTTMAMRRLKRESIRCEVSSAPRSEWLEIAIRRNAGHGHRMSVQDKVRAIHLLRTSGYKWEQVAGVLYLPVGVAKRIIAGRVVLSTQKGAKPAYAKAPLRAAAARMTAEDVEKAQAEMAGHDQEQILESAVSLFENDLIDDGNGEIVALVGRLDEVITAWMEEHGA